MVHWEWHAPVLSPGNLGHAVLSGTGFFTKEGRPAIIYGENEDLLLIYAQDDALDTWTSPEQVVVHDKEGAIRRIAVWDPDCWIKDGTYYAVGGNKGKDLIKSEDLHHWEYVGKLMHSDFPNGRQAMAYTHRRTHPHAEHALFSDQGHMPVSQVTAWTMLSPWDEGPE